MKIAGVREALEASKFALIQMIINPLIGRPQYWWHHNLKPKGGCKTLNISDIRCFSHFRVRQNAQSTPIQQGSKRDLVEQD